MEVTGVAHTKYNCYNLTTNKTQVKEFTHKHKIEIQAINALTS